MGGGGVAGSFQTRIWSFGAWSPGALGRDGLVGTEGYSEMGPAQSRGEGL